MEEAAIRKYHGTLFRELRSLRSANRNLLTLIKDNAGRPLPSEPECIARWQEHFSKLTLTLPTEELIEQANHPNACPLCTTDYITPEVVRKALGQLKNARIGHLYQHSQTVNEWRRGCRCDVTHQHIQPRLVNGADP